MTADSISDVLVYVGTFSENPDEGLYHFRLDPDTGALEPLGQTPRVPTPFYLTIDAARGRLYATNALDECDGVSGGAISAFDLDRGSGELTFLNRQPSGGGLPCYISVEATSRCLVTGNYNSGSVAALPITAHGLGPRSSLVQHEGSSVDDERQEGPHVHCMVLDPSERWALAADLGTDEVRVYELDAGAGMLTPAVPPPLKTKPGAGPRHIAFHPSGPWCYLLNELDSTLSVCAFDGDDGRLEELQTEACLPAGFTDTNYASDVKVLPSGRFLYTTNRGHDSIAVFAVDGYTGRVEFVSHEEAQGSWPWNLGIDPTVGFLLATNYESDRVSVFRIDPETGALTPTQSQASVPKPTCVAMLAR